MKSLLMVALMGLIAGQVWAGDSKLPDLAQIKVAAEKGDAKAQFELGKTYRGRGDMENAEKWFLLSAGQGVAEAEFAYGDCLMNGFSRIVNGKLVNRPPNPAQAFGWYMKAANHGYNAAYVTIGQMYRDGKGVRQSNIEAYKYFTIADKLGQSSAKVYRDSLILKLSSHEISTGQQAAEVVLNSLPKK